MNIADIYNPTAAKRASRKKQQSSTLKTLANAASATAATIPSNHLTPWDKASLTKAEEFAEADTVEELRRMIARIYELAGEHYGISKELFWHRYHNLKALNRAAG